MSKKANPWQVLQATLTTIGVFAFIGLLIGATIQSCSTSFTRLVETTFTVSQTVSQRGNAFLIKTPLRFKGYFIELTDPALKTICSTPESPIMVNRAVGGEQCFDNTCRFYFNHTKPARFEYLTQDEQGDCTVINNHEVEVAAFQRLYEVSILIPESLTEGSWALQASRKSQFNAYSELTIGQRSRVDLEYLTPIRQDHFFINDIPFTVKVDDPSHPLHP